MSILNQFVIHTVKIYFSNFIGVGFTRKYYFSLLEIIWTFCENKRTKLNKELFCLVESLIKSLKFDIDIYTVEYTEYNSGFWLFI